MSLSKYRDIILDEVNIKNLEMIKDVESLIEYRAKGLISKLGPKFGPKAKAVAEKISQLVSGNIKRLKTDGRIGVELPDGPVEVEIEDLEISTISMAGVEVKQEGDDYVALDIQLTSTLIGEGLARELVHKIQNLRKDSGFEVADRIEIAYSGDGELEEAIAGYEHYIRSETLAVGLQKGSAAGGQKIEINGKEITIAINQAQS